MRRSNNIIRFRRRTKSKDGGFEQPVLHYGQTNLSLDYLNQYVNTQSTFNKEYGTLLGSFKTRNAKFMFPTILCRYRKNINPTKALYNCLQEAMFNYCPENIVYKWTVDLFKDKEWLDVLVLCLQKDIENITAFIEKYAHFPSTYTSGKILELINLKKDFMHYIEVFSIMKTWDCR